MCAYCAVKFLGDFMKVVYSVRSHKGNIREKNEDNFFANGITLAPEYRNRPFSIDAISFSPVVLAVCDGMGGEESGEFASLTVVQKISEAELQAQKELNSAVRNCIEAANNEINSLGKRSGTTLALAVISEKGTHCFNVGDSRIYLLKKGSFSRVTNDHTKGAERVKNGAIPSEKERRIEGGNQLTRCIGIGNYRSAENYPVISGKYRLLICSDGLTDMVSDAEINRVVSENTKIADVAETLLRTALNKGGEDNITIIAADISHSRFIKK